MTDKSPAAAGTQEKTTATRDERALEIQIVGTANSLAKQVQVNF